MSPGCSASGFLPPSNKVAKTRAYRLAEASLLAPYTNTAIIWAALAGWLLWREFPSPAVIAGTLVVIASNLFNAWREVR